MRVQPNESLSMHLIPRAARLRRVASSEPFRVDRAAGVFDDDSLKGQLVRILR